MPHITAYKLSLLRFMKSIEGLRNEAYGLLLFLLREHWYQLHVWADEETSNIIRSTVEQAFLEISMSTLGINETLPVLEDKGWMSGLSAIPAIIGSQTHNLDLNTTIQCGLDLYSQHLCLAVA